MKKLALSILVILVGFFAGKLNAQIYTPDSIIQGASGSSSYVGIGTSTPAYNLDVAGIVNADSLYINGEKIDLNAVSAITFDDDRNTSVGTIAGNTGEYNTSLGFAAGSATEGTSNTYLGYYAGANASTGGNNTVIGAIAGKELTTGANNTFVGKSAGRDVTAATYNTMIGHQAGVLTTAGGANTFLGSNAGFSNKNGSRNIYIGDRAGFLDTAGLYNVFIGYHSGYNNTGSQNIFLGYEAGKDETGSNKLYIENSNDAAPLIYGEFNNDLLVFNGTVGVGTSPITGYDFSVKGKIIAQELRIDADPLNWPDYVFGKNYHLRSLKEVEEYIQENKHLPDVPSAAEVAEDGYEVGDMNEVLLKKVEELTLYIIEQNKKIEKLETEMQLIQSGNNQ